jgi:uncharacterized iron-regulated membrane protein
MKRHLYLWHRWLGIALCLFMALWFVSGIVMLYVGYPKLTPSERLESLPALATRDCCASLATVLDASGARRAPQSIRLTSIAGEPRFLLGYPGHAEIAVDARSGRRIDGVDAQAALASARAFGHGAEATYLGLVDEDMWSHSRALAAERPLHVVQLADGQQRRLYLSSHSGQVLLDATARERAWNWLGAWLHWLYPLRGGWLDGVAADVVIYLSLAATLMALLGAVVGILRWRFRRPYAGGRRTPYRGLARWHHVGGLLFGAVLIAWIFSGLMSMRPWHLLDSRSGLAMANFQGGALQPERFPLPVAEALERFRQAGLHARELQWRLVGGQGFLSAYDAGRSLVLAMTPGAAPMLQVPATALEDAARRVAPEGVAQFQWLQAYDFYHYPRAEQSMNGAQRKRLPLLRVRFDDPAGTWLHIDPYSGALTETLDQRRRVARWVFNLLHSWDWLPLLEHPRLREALIIAFSLGGLLISVSGMVMGWRRLKRIPTRSHSLVHSGETP